MVLPGIAGGYGSRFGGSARPGGGSPVFSLALVLLLVVTITPLHTLAIERLLLVHLLQNVVLAEWAPLLLVLGLTPPMAAQLGALPGARVLVHPAVALPLWVVNYVAWHLPPAYDAALRSPHALLHLEHALYLATGILLWFPVVHDLPRALAPGFRAGTCSPPSSSPARSGSCSRSCRSRSTPYDGAGGSWRLSLLTDQQLAGATMALEQSVVFFAVFAFWTARFFAEQDHQDDPPDD